MHVHVKLEGDHQELEPKRIGFADSSMLENSEDVLFTYIFFMESKFNIYLVFTVSVCVWTYVRTYLEYQSIMAESTTNSNTFYKVLYLVLGLLYILYMKNCKLLGAKMVSMQESRSKPFITTSLWKSFPVLYVPMYPQALEGFLTIPVCSG